MARLQALRSALRSLSQQSLRQGGAGAGAAAGAAASSGGNSGASMALAGAQQVWAFFVFSVLYLALPSVEMVKQSQRELSWAPIDVGKPQKKEETIDPRKQTANSAVLNLDLLSKFTLRSPSSASGPAASPPPPPRRPPSESAGSTALPRRGPQQRRRQQGSTSPAPASRRLQAPTPTATSSSFLEAPGQEKAPSALGSSRTSPGSCTYRPATC